MEDIKSQFHNISTELETLLEQFKTCYPRNVGQMIRQHTGKILVFSSLLILLPFFLSLSIPGMLFSFAAFPGILMFAVINMHSGNDEVKKEWKHIPVGGGFGLPFLGDADDEGNLYNQILTLKSQTTQYSQYPDARNYLEDFDKRFYTAAEAKKQVRSKFWKVILIGFGSIFLVSGILLARLLTGDVDNIVEHAMENVSPFHTSELLDANADTPLFVLKDLNTSDKAEFYYSDQNHSLTIIGVKKPYSSADNYLLTITDKDGVPVARSPRIRFDKSDQEIRTELAGERIDYVVFRLMAYLKENQQDLRYTVTPL